MRIVHVSGHEFLARTIRRCFEARGDDCHTVTDARQAMEVIAAVAPDVVLTGYEAFPLNAPMLAREVAATLPDTAVVLFTMSEDPFAIRSTLDAGALAYVAKSCSFADLAQLLDQLVVGDRVLSPSYASLLLACVEGFEVPVSAEDEWLLRQVASGMSTTEIALDSDGDGPRTRLGRVLELIDGTGRLTRLLGAVDGGFIDIDAVSWAGPGSPLPSIGWRWALALRSVAAGMDQTERLLRGTTPGRSAMEMGESLGMGELEVNQRLDRVAHLLGQPGPPQEFLLLDHERATIA